MSLLLFQLVMTHFSIPANHASLAIGPKKAVNNLMIPKFDPNITYQLSKRNLFIVINL